MTSGEKLIWCIAFAERLASTGYKPDDTHAMRATQIKHASDYARKLVIDSRYLRGLAQDDKDAYGMMTEVLDVPTEGT